MRALVLVALLASTAGAQDFSAGSKANSWGLAGEEKATFSGRVLDAICALGGDCPADCGAGKRQMVIVRDSDKALVLAMKNGQPIFSGATVDLAPYCGKHVTVDGLLVGDKASTPGLQAKLFQVQTVATDWAAPVKTEAFDKAWDARNPDAKGPGAWYERDPHVKDALAKDGRFGLGLDVDQVYIKENF